MEYDPHEREQESSEGKLKFIATKANSDFKWQTDGAIGALEVPSVPDLELEGEYTTRNVKGQEVPFGSAVALWNARQMKDEFIRACKNVPKATCCCGLIKDDDGFIEDIVKSLNQGWIKSVNQKLSTERQTFKLDAFVWSWFNATGKSSTKILLVRFLHAKQKTKVFSDDFQNAILEDERQ